MKLLLTLLLVLFNVSTAVADITSYTTYDKYGRKINTFKTVDKNTTCVYDKYGRKVSTMRKQPSGDYYIYDKYGRKTGVVKD